MDYSDSLQKTIVYIESNLGKNLSAEKLAGIAGFSKYHFVRVFKQEIGCTLFEYIQSRRMARAAKRLLYSDQNILQIALSYQFESQEAFTRAFQKEYALTPGRYRKAMSNFLGCKESEFMENRNTIPGWLVTGTAPRDYKVEFDREIYHRGTQSVRMTGDGSNIEEDDYMTVMQQFKAAGYLNKRVRFSAFIKTKNVAKWSGLWMRVNGITSNILKIDNMQNRPIKGTNDWNYYSVVLDIPENSNIINIGVLLNGKGTIWMDHLNFEVVDKNVDTTDVDLSSELPEQPLNLSLEESKIDLGAESGDKNE